MAAPFNDWFLRQWMATLGMTQEALRVVAGWDKRKASELVNGKQRYNRDIVNEAAFALHIQPFELLMHPDDAMALRRLRESALRIAADSRLDFTSEPQLDGTHG